MRNPESLVRVAGTPLVIVIESLDPEDDWNMLHDYLRDKHRR
jgi:hypothetical protein